MHQRKTDAFKLAPIAAVSFLCSGAEQKDLAEILTRTNDSLLKNRKCLLLLRISQLVKKFKLI